MSTAGAGPKPSDLAPNLEGRHQTDLLTKVREIVAKEIRMMNTARRSISLAISVVFALASLALAAPRAEASGKFVSIAGQVRKIDSRQRTLLVADRSTEKLYLVKVPEGANLKITWGRYMRMAEPSFEDVFNKDRVEIRCYRPDSEHLAQLEDGRNAIKLTAVAGK
jgi:hypothetical protein